MGLEIALLLLTLIISGLGCNSSSMNMEATVWSCEASGVSRSYTVELLNRSSNHFELKIYDAPNFLQGNYKETIEITVENTDTLALVGTGQTSTGEQIRVTALNSAVDFTVTNSKYGTAVGRCVLNVEMN